MKPKFDLQGYLAQGVEKIVKGALKASLSNPQESVFMAKYALSAKKASKIRAEYEEKGEHIPPFLIASITSACNLHCAGCYARSIDSCSDNVPSCQLSDDDWLRIFKESRDLGIGFIILAGGEPLLRKGVIEAAGKIPEILFPVITNGTMLDENYLKLFKKSRNLVPVVSVEGRGEKTDERRGEGMYDKLSKIMDNMNREGVLFGVSVTVTKENLAEVTSEEFLSTLEKKGCRLIFFIEFVPVTEDVKDLAPGDNEREILRDSLAGLREKFENMLLVSFPGDEKASFGCLAAGRGFFHINSHGGAEPCPFSPYSDINVKDTSVREALKSGLFTKLKESETLNHDHDGGCTLFLHQDEVVNLLRK